MRLIIGNLAIDKIFFENEKESPGGPPYFISKALNNQNIKQISILSCAGNDFDINFFPEIKGTILNLIKKDNTSKIGIKKDSEDKEYGFLIDYSGIIEKEDLKNIKKNPEIVYVSTILQDVSSEALNYFKNSIIALDIQGFIRKPSNKRWVREKWTNAKDYLKNVTILKMSDYEKDFFPISFEETNSFGKLEVILLTLGKKGVVAYSKGNYYFMPALAKEIKNPVGAGDYILTCFTENYSKSHNIENALIHSSLEVAKFLQGKDIGLSLEEANKKLSITKYLYIPQD